MGGIAVFRSRGQSAVTGSIAAQQQSGGAFAQGQTVPILVVRACDRAGKSPQRAESGGHEFTGDVRTDDQRMTAPAVPEFPHGQGRRRLSRSTCGGNQYAVGNIEDPFRQMQEFLNRIRLVPLFQKIDRTHRGGREKQCPGGDGEIEGIREFAQQTLHTRTTRSVKSVIHPQQTSPGFEVPRSGKTGPSFEKSAAVFPDRGRKGRDRRRTEDVYAGISHAVLRWSSVRAWRPPHPEGR